MAVHALARRSKKNGPAKLRDQVREEVLVSCRVEWGRVNQQDVSPKRLPKTSGWSRKVLCPSRYRRSAQPRAEAYVSPGNEVWLLVGGSVMWKHYRANGLEAASNVFHRNSGTHRPFEEAFSSTAVSVFDEHITA